MPIAYCLFTLQVAIHLNSINRGSKKPIKGFIASLINSATCSSSTRHFKALISVIPSFNSSTKTWQLFSNNSSNCFLTTLLRLSVKTTPHLNGHKLGLQAILPCSWVCLFTVLGNLLSRRQWLARLLFQVFINHPHLHLCSELLGIHHLDRLVALNFFGLCINFQCSQIKHIRKTGKQARPLRREKRKKKFLTNW